MKKTDLTCAVLAAQCLKSAAASPQKQAALKRRAAVWLILALNARRAGRNRR